MRRNTIGALLLFGVLAMSTQVDAGINLTGRVAPEVRIFTENGQYPGQETGSVYPSVTAEAKLVIPEVLPEVTFTASPSLRYDGVDRERTNLNLHGLKVDTGGELWHAKLGYDVEFWGVMEFLNPVNVINQSDIPDDFLGKSKLGQPMASLSLISPLGAFDFYALAFFQPMKFHGTHGRLRPGLAIAEGGEYLDGDGRSHVEGAVHFTKTIENVFIGFSHFYGYDRQPEFAIKLTDAFVPYLAPQYHLEHQTGVELQMTMGNLILKSEDVVRLDAHGTKTSYAVAAGGEYDVGALIEWGGNINLLCEYHYDERSETLVTPFTNDLFFGVRVGFSDTRSTEVRVWSNYDFNRHRPEVVMADISVRISDRMKWVMAYRGIVSGKMPFDALADDSHLLFRLELFL